MTSSQPALTSSPVFISFCILYHFFYKCNRIIHLFLQQQFHSYFLRKHSHGFIETHCSRIAAPHIQCDIVAITLFGKVYRRVKKLLSDILSKNNVNIRALSIAETQDFGILRLIVNDNETALKALQENDYLVKSVDVLGVKIGDAPGKLTTALDVLDKANINVEYLYAFMLRTEKHAYVVLRVENNEVAGAALEKAGYHLITEADVCKL